MPSPFALPIKPALPSKNVARWIPILCVLAIAALIASGPALAQGSPNLVISQIYGAGGNSGATFTNDYIEIFNRGTSSVSLAGKSLQYASATGTGNLGIANQITVLPSVTLGPGQYFLVQEAGGASGSPLPVTADVIVTTGAINMSGTGGKVALANSTTSLGCNGGSNPCSAAQLALIIDLIGYDGANFFEGSGAAPTLSATTAAFRAGDGCTDTDNNAGDFTARTPAPRNSASPLKSCDTGTPTSPTAVGVAIPSSVSAGDPITLSVTVTPGTNPASTGITVTGDLTSIGGSGAQAFGDNGDGTFSFDTTVSAATTPGGKTIPVSVSDAQGRSGTASIAVTVTAPVPKVAIHDIQGSGDFSPFSGQIVETEGIVTARATNGFFIQMADADADGDAGTPEAIFVFTSSAPSAAAAVGNRVKVRGKVQDFIPSSDPASPPSTEIAAPSVSVITTANALPGAVTLTAADLSPAGSFTQLRKYEGMRVHVDALNVVAPTDGSVNEANAIATSNGIFFGVLPGTPRPFREPGIEAPAVAPSGVPQFDGNPEKLRVDSDGQIGGTKIDVSTGAVVSNLTGVLEMSSRAYTLLPDPGTPSVSNNDAHAVPVRPGAGEGELTVGSFNLERFYDTTNDPSTSDVVLTAGAFDLRLKKASLAIRNVLQMPDILGVEEMENLAALQALAARIDSDAAAAGQAAPNYQAYLFEGNDIGGIDVGLLVKSGRVDVLSVEQDGKDTTFVQPDGATAILNDRPPLLMKANVKRLGKEMPLAVTVIVNHLRSLTGIDDVSDGPRIRSKRLAQAEFLANLINLHQQAGEQIVSVGDYNAFDVNDGYVDVINTVRGGTPHPTEDVLGESAQLVDPALIDLAPADAAQHYSYVFNGSAQVLDHIIVSQGLTVNEFAYARNDADFPETLRGDGTRPERVSDHDAPVAYFGVPRDTVPPVVTLTGVTEGATYILGTVPNATCTTTDAASGVATPATLSITGGDALGVGALTATCSGAVDNVGNTADAVSAHYAVVVYTFGGFGPPLGTGMSVKSGSTVPVKFQIRDWNGTVMTNTSVVKSIQFVPNGGCGGDANGEWTDTTATGGTSLRFDATANAFVYNWKTTGLSAGCYSLNVTTADTLAHTVEVTIR